MSTSNKNISFTSQMEQNGSLPLLDIKVNRENNKFVTQLTESLHLLRFLRLLEVLFPNVINVVQLILRYIEDLVYVPIWKFSSGNYFTDVSLRK